ncbi:MAG: hypothetical protein JNL90_15365 [Planctomycetes bacterium]|nr:hypothetical protein [Planctomycetota bacterium]
MLRHLTALVAPLTLASLASAQATELRSTTPASGGAFQEFGASLALDGDVALVGAPGDTAFGSFSGAAHVLRFVGGAWTLEQKLFASDAETGAGFGRAVAVVGDVAFVAAPDEDNANGIDAGAVYVFRRDPVTAIWSEEQKLVAASGAAGDGLGRSIAASGDLLIAGAPRSDLVAADGGVAVVWRFDAGAGAWSEEAQLLDPDGAAGDEAGSAVAFDGVTALVGSPFSDESAVAAAGSVAVWSESGGSWSSAAELRAVPPEAFASFGGAVAIDGDDVLIGAPLEDGGGAVDHGAAWFFARVAGTWYLRNHIANPAPAAHDEFGARVALRGNTALIASPSDDGGGKLDGGAAFTVRHGRKYWYLDQELGASDVALLDKFGSAVAAGPLHLLVGAPLNNTSVGSNTGVVYEWTPLELDLDIDPLAPAPGQTITMTAFDGEPGAPLMIVVDEIDGTPVWLELILDVFAVDHRYALDVDATNPLFGATIGVRALKISPTGPVVLSPRVLVDV